jgi:NhaA family Na+:H+ antiporter
VPVSLDPPLGPDDHVSGDPDAPYELVMYGDFECPYCAAAQSILARVRSRLGDDLRFAFRHLPLESVHPHARHAAEASEAAAAQGAFWEMHDALYAGRGRLEDADLVSHARALGLDAERVGRELAEGTHAGRVQRDADTAEALGLDSTPAFFVNGVLHADTYDAGSLVAALRERSSGA